MRFAVRRLLLASTLLGSVSFGAVPALAQTDATAQAAQPEGEVIVVTGSRIARPDLETSSPVNVVGQQEIALRQPNTAEELLRDMPSVRPNLGPAVNNGGDGSASIDLRGIGTNRTLVLLDGRRLVPFGLDGVTDLNTIPIGLVERVDVVTGGASSVYGADAVAGVVNFITKSDFSGVDFSANYRVTERGDARQYRADLITGANFDDGRGNVVLALGYSDRDDLVVTKRDIARFPISSVNGGFSGATAAVPTILGAPGNAALGLPASNFGAAYDPVLGRFRAATAADTYNTNENTYFQTPLERYNIYAAARYEITEGVELYSTGMFARNKALIQLASSGTFGNTYQMPLNNPYLTADARNQLCRGTDTNLAVSGVQSISQAACDAAGAAQGPGSAGYLEIPVIAQRRFVEYGPRGNAVESTQFQVQVGLRGDITDGLRYDISGQYGETNQNQTRDNWGSFSKVQQALRAYRNAAGQAVCSNTANGCVPLNLFGPAGSITPDQLAFIDLDALIRRTVTQTVVTGSVSGDVFNLTSPFADAPLGFAIGAEYRKLSARSNPDAPSQIQGEVLGTGARTPPDFGKYDVKEVFGELLVPLAEEKPFFYNLTLEAGIRYSDYSTTGASTTWKAGGNYEPFEGFKFRGMYQKAVRSPNIQELFQSPVQALSNLTVDPCQSSALPSTAANPALAALCVYTGAPAGSIGSIPQPTSGQINVTTSGNRDLDVERARTYTLGGVISPTYWPGWSLTVDYFNIKVTDAISNPTAGDILNGCYSTALNPTLTPNAFCDLIRRNPLTGSLNGAGETPGVILAGSNLGKIETAGIDIGVNYRFNLDELGLDGEPGSLSIGFNATWLDYYHFQATPNSINRDCTGRYSTNCTNPRAEWKWNGRLTYSIGPADISLLWTHISPVSIEPPAPTPRPDFGVPQTGGPNPATVLDAFERIPAYDYFDLAANVEVGENLELSFTIDNLFDKKPPLVGNGVGGTAFNNGNTFPTLYDVLGRSYTVGARLKF